MSIKNTVDDKLSLSLNKNDLLEMTLIECGYTGNRTKETWKFIFGADSKCCELYRPNNLRYERLDSNEYEIRFSCQLDSEVTEIIMVCPFGGRIKGDICHDIGGSDGEGELLYYIQG